MDQQPQPPAAVPAPQQSQPAPQQSGTPVSAAPSADSAGSSRRPSVPEQPQPQKAPTPPQTAAAPPVVGVVQTKPEGDAHQPKPQQLQAPQPQAPQPQQQQPAAKPPSQPAQQPQPAPQRQPQLPGPHSLPVPMLQQGEQPHNGNSQGFTLPSLRGYSLPGINDELHYPRSGSNPPTAQPPHLSQPRLSQPDLNEVKTETPSSAGPQLHSMIHQLPHQYQQMSPLPQTQQAQQIHVPQQHQIPPVQTQPQTPQPQHQPQPQPQHQHQHQQMMMGYIPMYQQYGQQQYGQQHPQMSYLPQPGQPQQTVPQVAPQPMQPQQPVQPPPPVQHPRSAPQPIHPQQSQQPQAPQPQPAQQPQQPQPAPKPVSQSSTPQQSQQQLAQPQPQTLHQATPQQQAQILQQLPQQQQSELRPLNVCDALSYLEQVKAHFANQPDVYNHFLDIMKDFKSHSIDTPGVIDRVSSLFRGHANLIQGFNTFLPPGYSIHCSLDPNDPNPVRVTTPMGSQMLPHVLTAQAQAQAQVQQQPQSQPAHHDQQVQQQVQQAQQLQQQRQQTHANARAHAAAQAQAQQAQQYAQYAHAQPLAQLAQQSSPSMQHVQTADGMQQLDGQEDGRQNNAPVEFSHAISYVNRIKNHYSNQPEIYKQFLEILQTYQREQLRISEVYAQVQHLFSDAPDLLEGFKNFLPDTSPGVQGSEPNGAEVNQDMRLPPLGSFGPAQPQMTTAQSAPHPQQGRVLQGQPPTSSTRGRGQRNGVGASGALSSNQFVPSAKPAGVKTASRSSLSDEIAFFDKVKKVLPKQAYHEFLKALNLFTQRIIDVEALVHEVEQFIGQHEELITWFKRFVGYEGTPLRIENISLRKHLVDLSQCRSYGRSYRLLPKTEHFMPCSGRDELGWEVFNDEWVGHPTWASEDSGFVAHRKNQYEEILFRVEEERHEYDHYIGANQRTIQVLETIANRMAAMSTAELAAFKLPEGLGYGTKIYQKVIRKIYDKKNGLEVIESLHENPGAAVPVVLRRLKQKDEEWRRAQREWNKVWREAEQKAYYKSLDHLGLTFKQADRKQLTSRSLLSEIMAVKAEQTAKRRLAATNLPPLPTPKAQLDFVVEDYDVLKDLKALIVKYIEFKPNFSFHDKELCRQFIDVFVNEFFAPGVLKSAAVAPLFGSENTDGDKPVANGDTEAPQDEDVPMPDAPTDAEPVAPAKEASWLKFERMSSPLSDPPRERSQFNLFGTTPLYLFLRIFQILYARLAEVKGFESMVSETLAKSRKTPFAVELGLYDSRLEQMGLRFDPKDVYGQTLRLCHRLLEEDVEPQWFEEALRQAYRNRAYKLYTIDKALQSLVKQLHAVITDQGSIEAVKLWEEDRQKTTMDIRSQIELRMRVKQAAAGISGGVPSDSYGAAGSAEPLFRIAWSPQEHKMSFQSLGPYDVTLKGVMDDQQRWEYYVTSYMMSLPTEGVPLDLIHAPFLQRVLPEDIDENDHRFEVLAEDLQARICFNTYKMFFEPGTADYLVNVGKRGNAAKAHALRSERWKASMAQAEEALHQAEADAAKQQGVESGDNTRAVEPPIGEPNGGAVNGQTNGQAAKPAIIEERPEHLETKVTGLSEAMKSALPVHPVQPVELVQPKPVQQ